MSTTSTGVFISEEEEEEGELGAKRVVFAEHSSIFVS